jgi:hypothetical protein
MLVLSFYLNLGKLQVVKIYPESVLNGLIKIGGILGLIGVIIAVANILNERRLKT